LKSLVLPEAYDRFVANGHWNWISEIGEWRAFRLLFLPTSVTRECDPADLRQLQRMIEQAFDETEQTNNEKEKSAEPCAAANPAGASRLQLLRPVRRVAEFGSLGIVARMNTSTNL